MHSTFPTIKHETEATRRARGEASASSLTFAAFRQANVARATRWHPQGIASWSPSDWLTAITGELGELASLIKMRCRERDGLPGNKFSPTDRMLADELADVFTYLDLLAAVLGVDLGAAAIAKFNEISERVGFPDRITTSRLVRGETYMCGNRKGVLIGSHPHDGALYILNELDREDDDILVFFAAEGSYLKAVT